jgi:hypothetical protein
LLRNDKFAVVVWEDRLASDYSIGIFAVPKGIWIPATRGWQVSQQYNGHDKIHHFSSLPGLMRDTGQGAESGCLGYGVG